MALIKCSECGKEISENATACPNCGNPINLTKDEKEKAIKQNEQQNNINVIIALVSIVIIGAILFIGFSSLWKGLKGDEYLKSKGIDTSNNTLTLTTKDDEKYEQWEKDAMNWLGFEKQ